MTEAEIRQGVLKLLHRAAPECDLAQIDPGANLREALEIDSFDFLNIMIGVHEQFGVTVPESDYAGVSTLNDIVTYIGNAGR